MAMPTHVTVTLGPIPVTVSQRVSPKERRCGLNYQSSCSKFLNINCFDFVLIDLPLVTKTAPEIFIVYNYSFFIFAITRMHFACICILHVTLGHAK